MILLSCRSQSLNKTGDQFRDEGEERSLHEPEVGGFILSPPLVHMLMSLGKTLIPKLIPVVKLAACMAATVSVNL